MSRAAHSRPVLAAVLAVLVLGAAGCGSSSSSSTSTPRTNTANPAATTGTSSTALGTTGSNALRVGQFCSPVKERAYRARGFTCINRSLKKLRAHGSGAAGGSSGGVAPGGGAGNSSGGVAPGQ